MDNSTVRSLHQPPPRHTDSEHNDFDVAFLAYVCFLMIVGITGNAAVFFVYALKFKKSNYKNFIICLSLIDCLMCCVGMPKTIMLIRFPEVFEDIATCKSITFIVKLVAGLSLIMLLIIAMDRYWKVCRPIQSRIYHFHGKTAIAVTSCVTFVLLSPALALYGETKTVNGTVSTSCTVRDEFTVYNEVYEGTLFLIVVGIFIALGVFYSLIGRQILKSKKGLDTQPAIAKNSNQSKFFIHLRDLENSDETTYAEDMESLNEDDQKGNNVTKVGAKTKQRTFILFVVTMATVISWLPHFTMEILQATNQHMYDTMSPGLHFLCRFFFFSYYWNTLCNPILYGICDLRFRSEIKKWFGNILQFCGVRQRSKT